MRKALTINPKLMTTAMNTGRNDMPRIYHSRGQLSEDRERPTSAMAESSW
jgi:hypothetical protein